MTNYYCTFV